MKRYSLCLTLMFGAWALSMPAYAQRRGAEITQGMTSGELAATVEDLRASSAELGARLTGLEADRAALNGQVETLEFLLSQSRNEVNQMQSDNAEIGNLIGRLEAQINAQQVQIRSLQARLDQMTASAIDRSSVEMGLGPAPASSETETTDFDSAGSSSAIQPEVRAGGPTQIVRRSEGEGDQLPQGSLGTLSASALPGEAGPLFAEAKSRLLQFDYAGAETAFRAFLSQFSDDPQAGEAQYWLGEVLYQQEAYSESGEAYTQMIRQYPEDPRAPEALAKLARSMRLIGDTERACNALDILPQRYPDASGVTRNLAAGERVRSGCDS